MRGRAPGAGEVGRGDVCCWCCMQGLLMVAAPVLVVLRCPAGEGGGGAWAWGTCPGAACTA